MNISILDDTYWDEGPRTDVEHVEFTTSSFVGSCSQEVALAQWVVRVRGNMVPGRKSTIAQLSEVRDDSLKVLADANCDFFNKTPCHVQDSRSESGLHVRLLHSSNCPFTLRDVACYLVVIELIVKVGVTVFVPEIDLRAYTYGLHSGRTFI